MDVSSMLIHLIGFLTSDIIKVAQEGHMLYECPPQHCDKVKAGPLAVVHD